MKREVIVFIILIGVFLAIGCTESNSEGVNVSDTATNGEDVLSTEPEDVATTAGEMTNIFPRPATNEGTTKPQDIDGIVTNTKSPSMEIYGTIDVKQIPATIWVNDAMTQGVVIESYTVGEQGVEVKVRNIGIDKVNVEVGAVLQKSKVFDNYGVGHTLSAGSADKITFFAPRNENIKALVVKLEES